MTTARRSIVAISLGVSTALFCFSVGSWSTQRRFEEQIAASDSRIQALRDEMAAGIVQKGQSQAVRPLGTDGREPEVVTAAGGSQQSMVDEIKRQLQSEMGLLPVRLLRERRTSFVELNAYDNFGTSSYGTAGYLGNGYFITVKHAVISLDERDGNEPRRITSIKILHQGKQLSARVVDAGNADAEVHPGDWAIIQVREPIDLPPLRLDTTFAYEFAEPIFRLGNDYSKGIMLSTGYIGQRTANGLVTCLTDGHPGVSGGGVLDQEGNLVGIPIGRMQGDYRFSFILPLRAAMFRKVPGVVSHLNQQEVAEP